MAKLISEATEANGVRFTLEVESDGMVRLECSRDYKGNSHCKNSSTET